MCESECELNLYIVVSSRLYCIPGHCHWEANAQTKTNYKEQDHGGMYIVSQMRIGGDCWLCAAAESREGETDIDSLAPPTVATHFAMPAWLKLSAQ